MKKESRPDEASEKEVDKGTGNTVFRGYSLPAHYLLYSLPRRGALGWKVIQNIQSWAKVVYKRANPYLQCQDQTAQKDEQHSKMWLLAVRQRSHRAPSKRSLWPVLINCCQPQDFFSHVTNNVMISRWGWWYELKVQNEQHLILSRSNRHRYL